MSRAVTGKRSCPEQAGGALEARSRACGGAAEPAGWERAGRWVAVESQSRERERAVRGQEAEDGRRGQGAGVRGRETGDKAGLRVFEKCVAEFKCN